jgi:hypothetical protein
VRAQHHLLIARQLRLIFPAVARFSEKIFARAAADYIRCWRRDMVSEAAIVTYLKSCAPKDLLDIVPRTLYHLIRRIGPTQAA